MKSGHSRDLAAAVAGHPDRHPAPSPVPIPFQINDSSLSVTTVEEFLALTLRDEGDRGVRSAGPPHTLDSLRQMRNNGTLDGAGRAALFVIELRLMEAKRGRALDDRDLVTLLEELLGQGRASKVELKSVSIDGEIVWPAHKQKSERPPFDDVLGEAESKAIAKLESLVPTAVPSLEDIRASTEVFITECAYRNPDKDSRCAKHGIVYHMGCEACRYTTEQRVVAHYLAGAREQSVAAACFVKVDEKSLLAAKKRDELHKLVMTPTPDEMKALAAASVNIPVTMRASAQPQVNPHQQKQRSAPQESLEECLRNVLKMIFDCGMRLDRGQEYLITELRQYTADTLGQPNGLTRRIIDICDIDICDEDLSESEIGLQVSREILSLWTLAIQEMQQAGVGAADPAAIVAMRNACIDVVLKKLNNSRLYQQRPEHKDRIAIYEGMIDEMKKIDPIEMVV